MNRIVLIGNGFDLAHGLKTKYEDFINWYWDQRVRGFIKDHSKVSQDILCTFKLLFESSWSALYYNYFLPYQSQNNIGKEVVQGFLENPKEYEVTYSPFFKNILKHIETKGWVDIENEYYNLLTEYALSHVSDSGVTALNQQLHFIQEMLIKYLYTINQQEIKVIDSIKKKIYAPIKTSDVSIEATIKVKEHVEWWKKQESITLEQKLFDYGITGINKFNYIYDVEDYKKDLDRFKDYPSIFMLPERIMLLSFNYTKTAQSYLMEGKQNFILNYIHGKVEKPQSVIFGYGDELDDNYKKLQKHNNKECLCNVKTIKYQEADNYRKVLSFIESAPFQVLIMGHSCGNSDRTLLNTLFEHNNCISIKPYYYIKKDGTDNYLDLIQNISKNFTDMKLMRDRVVNKLYCEPLAQTID